MVSKRNTKMYVKYNTNKLNFTFIFVFLTNTLYSIHASMSCAIACRWTADKHCFCNKIANNGRIPMKPLSNDPQLNSIPFACMHCPPMTIFDRVVAPLPRAFYTFVCKWDF